MNSMRYRVAGAITLVVGGAGVLAQYIVTPLSNGNMTGAETGAETVAAHHTAMTVALVLDSPTLLALPAVLVIGGLARARTSLLAALATVLWFGSTLLVIPQLFGLDGLAFLAGSEPDKAAMTHLIDSWQNSTWFAVGLFPYLLSEIVGSGEVIFGATLARRMGHFFTAGRDGDAHPFPELTTRERDVLEHLADGSSKNDIAAALGLSEKTVRNNVSNMFAKLLVADRGGAVAKARGAGLGS